nr:SRPBCC domain-containing protein [Mesorhizobium sp. WSM3626]
MDLPASGEFLEIEAPRRIVQTRAYQWDHPTLGRRPTTVAWLLEPISRGTRLTICMAALPGCMRRRPNMQRGGRGCWPGSSARRGRKAGCCVSRGSLLCIPFVRLDPDLVRSTSNAWQNRHAS